jgi:hypothetical protein
VDSTSAWVSDVYKYDETGEFGLGVDSDGEPYQESPCAAKF